MNRNELTKIIKESLINYFYESLNSQKQKYGNDLVNKLLPLDPSKNYKYIEQICNYYNEGISEKEIKEYIDLYDEKLTKNLIPKEYSDINKIKTFKDLKDIVDNKSQETSHMEAKNNLMKESYLDTITTDKGTFNVYRPYNTLQSIQLGKHTVWCISQIIDKNQFNQYFITNDIRFYIFIKDNNEKYQLVIYPEGKKQVWTIVNALITCNEFKELTDIDCKDYSWYPINEYVKDVIIYDKFGHKTGRMINNKREGKWIEYYNDKDIKVKISYKNGKLDGELIEYYENGDIRTKQYYKDGNIVDSIGIYYDKDGKTENIEHYNNGGLNSERIKYYKNGNMQYHIEYRDGKMNGKYEKFDKNGNIIITKCYKNDKEIDCKDK